MALMTHVPLRLPSLLVMIRLVLEFLHEHFLLMSCWARPGARHRDHSRGMVTWLMVTRLMMVIWAEREMWRLSHHCFLSRVTGVIVVAVVMM